MRGAHVSDNDLLLSQGLGKRSCSDRAAIEKALHGLAGGRVAGSAVIRFEFEAVKDGGIVTGGNHHAADGALVFHRKGDRGCGCRHGRQHHLEIICGKHLRGAPAELIREKAAVIADDDSFLGTGRRMRAPIISRGLGNTGDIGEGKILSNNRTPTVRAKFDLNHSKSLAEEKPAAKSAVGSRIRSPGRTGWGRRRR